MKKMTNCLIFAVTMWLASFGQKWRRYLWVRWSYSFRGLIPHGGVAQGSGWKTLAVVEAIPPKSRLGTLDNVVLLFVPKYRVWVFRVHDVRRFDHLDDALAFASLRR